MGNDGEVFAVIFVPARPADRARYRRECHLYLRRRGYQLAAITSSPDAVAQLWVEGRANRVIVARPEHRVALTPGVEVAMEPPARTRRWRTRRVPR